MTGMGVFVDGRVRWDGDEGFRHSGHLYLMALLDEGWERALGECEYPFISLYCFWLGRGREGGLRWREGEMWGEEGKKLSTEKEIYTYIPSCLPCLDIR